MTFKKSALLILISSLSALSAVSQAAITESSKMDQAKEDANFETYWNEYALTASGCKVVDSEGKCLDNDYAFHIQTHCTPMKYEPKGPSKGTVVFFTGFTNCPQEFYLIAQALQARGYEVLLPLLPGHGHVTTKDWTGHTVDDLSAMPNQAKEYEELIDRMSDLIKNRPGSHMVVGHSVGGNVAFRALEMHPEVFDRGLLIAPFFDTAGGFKKVSNAELRDIGKLTYYWRTTVFPDFDDFLRAKLPQGLAITPTSCFEDIANHKNVEGYCSYHMENLAAARELGQTSIKEFDQVIAPFQVVGVSPDPSADDVTTVQILDNLKDKNIASACFMKNIKHAMLDPFTPNNYWIPHMIKNIVNYLDLGIPFPTDGISPEGSYPYCQL